MSDDAGGSHPAVPPPPAHYPAPSTSYPSPSYPALPPPGYPTYPPPTYPGYPPPGYPAYPPPGYQAVSPPGYPAVSPPGYPQGYPAPGYQGYPPPTYAPPDIKPGVIPLRPLSLSDIYNGAIAYVRMNPKASLGLTAIVVVSTQVLALLLQVGPLAATGSLRPAFAGGGGEPSAATLVGTSLSSLASFVTTWLASVVLSGLLTVVVGRAVFGAGITIGEAWQRVRGRLLPLFGVTALEAVGYIVIAAVGVGIVAGVAVAANGGAAILVGLPLALVLGAGLVYLWTMLSFAPPLIVLERLGVTESITRSFKLVKNDFWRVLGIRLLALLVATMIAGAVTIPFSAVGQILLFGGGSDTAAIVALVLLAVGGAIGQIITAPFNAGVVVLQYADRRIRAEAFDLVLLTGAPAETRAAADSTDHLWLTPHP
jgi:hypothetical protein